MVYDGPIIDSHIHLWDPRTTPRTLSPAVRLLGWNRTLLTSLVPRLFPATSLAFVGEIDHLLAPYLPGMWLRDTGGRDVRGFVHVQADWQDTSALGQAGETRWLETICGSDLLAVVGRADLADDSLDALLDAHAAASPRFRGIRDYLAHGDGREVMGYAHRPDKAAQESWRRGYARLGARGLTFDAWMYSHQIPAVVDLVKAIPQTPVVVDHLATPIAAGGTFGGEGATPAAREAIVARWQDGISALAAVSHVRAKISGLAMPIVGFGWHTRTQAPSAEEVADAIGPFVEHALAAFGPRRCMLASNFPMDRPSLPWQTLYDAYDRLTASLPEADRTALYHDTAAAFYGIGDAA